MKLLLVLCLLFISSSTWALSGKEIWMNSNTKTRVLLLEEYKAFFQKQTEEAAPTYSDFEDKITFFQFNFISNAWADSQLNCIYAGWPSQRVGGFCSSPMRNNPEYEKGSCSSNQLQCQPLFFGKGLCVPVSTKSERNLAFSNCNKKFEGTKKTPEDVVHELRDQGLEPKLFELMDFAEKICKEGAQAKTPMCRRLESVIDSLRAFAKKADVPPIKKEDPVVEVTVEGVRVTDEKVKKDIVKSVEVTQKVVEKVAERKLALVAEDCPPEEAIAFERNVPRPLDFDFVTTRQGKDPSWSDRFISDKKEGLRYTGFKLTNVGENKIAGTPIKSGERVQRDWDFVTRDSSKRETYLWITDDTGSGKLSHLMESVIVILPRKMKPKTEIVDEDLHVTLTTGEKVIYDKKTREVKGGVFKEGPVGLRTNHFKRSIAAVTYTGKGISIRVDRRGADPRLSGMAEITQDGKICKLSAKELWNHEEFKFANDEELVEFLNKKCGKKFKLPN
jgi:hypothetical protein